MRGIDPGTRLIAAAAVFVVVASSAVIVALDRPFLGLALVPKSDGLVVVDSDGPGRGIARGSVVRAIGAQGARVELDALDLVEEPDFFDSYADMDRFFAKQSRLARLLRADRVDLVLGDGATRSIRAAPRRPFTSLPFGFFFQVGVGGIGFLISAIVFALRPRDRASRLFAGLGVAFLAFTSAAAIYSTRELALDGALFRALSAINQAGAITYGCFLVALFLAYPRALVRPRTLTILPLAFVPWFVAGQLRIAPDQDWGSRIPVMLQMTLALVFAGFQWRATRGDPRDRAALRWFGLALLVGSGLFVALTIASRAFGFDAPLPQGYAFGFFLLMDVGLALGLRRYRLFELEEWSFRIAFWLGAGLAFLALDLALVALLGFHRGASSSLALVLCALLYLPVRGVLWSRLSGTRSRDHADVIPAIVAIAFTHGHAERARRWSELLRTTFDPLVVTARPDSCVHVPAIVDEGLGLVVPAIGSAPAFALEFPARGRSLFGPRDLALVESMVALMRDADAGREAYERGALEERARIARDLHDDVGATLISGLLLRAPDELHASIRHALGELRAIVGTLAGDRVSAADLIADLRSETSERLAAASIEVTWEVADVPEDLTLSHDAARQLVSVVRELVTNVLRHAKARRVAIDLVVDADRVTVSLEDDGVGLSAAHVEGHGFGNLRARAAKADGTIRFLPRETGLRVEVELGTGARS